ncbi:MAG: CehA/McbA family metallohydrolase [Planctomycetes bacterium]|nr:CehA/McbA family metallohydrolase [Planctomycetota bacterium]
MDTAAFPRSRPVLTALAVLLLSILGRRFLVAEEKPIDPAALEQTLTQVRNTMNQARFTQDSFLPGLRDILNRAQAALEMERQAGGRSFTETFKILDELDSVSSFVVRVDGPRAAQLERGRAAPLRLYESASTPFLVSVYNRGHADIQIQLASNPEMRLEFRSSPSVTAKEIFKVAVGLLRPGRAGPQSLLLRLDLPESDQPMPLEEKLEVMPLLPVALSVQDENGQPVWAAFELRDPSGNLFPWCADRQAPDLSFQPQVYRTEGQFVALPPGRVHLKVTHGPEYRAIERDLDIRDAAGNRIEVRLERWIHLPGEGFYSGDTHVHAAGCRHFRDPNGILPEQVCPHLLGEDLHVVHLLNYGVSFDFQKSFCEATPNRVSQPLNLLKYDLEVSAFPSSHMGHPVLLNLSRFDFPRSSWNLPIFDWLKEQPQALGGYAHPTFAHYAFDRPYDFGFIDALELPVDLILGRVDTYEMLNQDRESELFLYYRLLNCGLRLTPVGGSDFPCIFDRRVGSARAVARLRGVFSLDAWMDALRAGRTQASDGQGFAWLTVEGSEPGSEIALAKPVTLRAAARGAVRPGGWLEEGRLQIVVNGEVAAEKVITQPGSWQSLEADLPIDRSAWIAARLLYHRGGQAFSEEWGSGRFSFCSAHTGPLYVRVGGKPIRAARRDPRWLIGWIDAAWKNGQEKIRPEERDAAKAAFDEARRRYQQILEECP